MATLKSMRSRRLAAVGFVLVAALLSGGSARWWEAISDVTPQVTDLRVTDSDAATIEVTWGIADEAAHLAGYRDGYCVQGRLHSGHAWSPSVSCKAVTTARTPRQRP